MKKIICLVMVSVMLVLSMASCSRLGVSGGVSTAPCGDTALVGCWVAERGYTETSVDGGKATKEDDSDAGWTIMQLFSDGTGVMYYPDIFNGEIEGIDKNHFTWHAENDTLYMSHSTGIDFYTLSGNKLTIIRTDYESHNLGKYDDDGNYVGEIQVEHMYESKNCAEFERSNKTVAELVHDKYIEYVNSQK